MHEILEKLDKLKSEEKEFELRSVNISLIFMSVLISRGELSLYSEYTLLFDRAPDDEDFVYSYVYYNSLEGCRELDRKVYSLIEDIVDSDPDYDDVGDYFNLYEYDVFDVMTDDDVYKILINDETIQELLNRGYTVTYCGTNIEELKGSNYIMSYGFSSDT